MAEQTYISVTPSEIVQKAQDYAKDGFRLIQICCTKTPNEMFLLYTFEKLDLECENLTMPVNVGDTVPSISGVFFGAFLYENECHDLYGVNFSDMAVDFQGTFYETSVKYGFLATDADNNE